MPPSDLYCGPGSVDEPESDDEEATGDTGANYVYPGFVSACRTIGEALDEFRGPLWVDLESDCTSDVAPTEDDGGDWVEFDARSIRRALVGAELARYL